MTQDKHTALPWGVAYLDHNGQSVIMSAHTEIATCWHHSVGSLEKEMHQNAAFVVRAVNNHYQLVEALEKAEQALRDAHKFMGRGYIGSHTELFERVIETAHTARQALSNAKGDIDPAA